MLRNGDKPLNFKDIYSNKYAEAFVKALRKAPANRKSPKEKDVEEEVLDMGFLGQELGL